MRSSCSWRLTMVGSTANWPTGFIADQQANGLLVAFCNRSQQVHQIFEARGGCASSSGSRPRPTTSARSRASRDRARKRQEARHRPARCMRKFRGEHTKNNGPPYLIHSNRLLLTNRSGVTCQQVTACCNRLLAQPSGGLTSSSLPSSRMRESDLWWLVTNLTTSHI